jgi:hypothetical protein
MGQRTRSLSVNSGMLVRRSPQCCVRGSRGFCEHDEIRVHEEQRENGKGADTHVGIGDVRPSSAQRGERDARARHHGAATMDAHPPNLLVPSRV